jgi:HK97 family phage prohead protease
MWDMFGPYQEGVSRGALDESLKRTPDVAFLVNHKGVTMARTTSGTLELAADSTGLAMVAYLNPKRQDVQDLVHAIDDGDIDQMSFAFRIPEGGGRWNDDFSEYWITEADIDRGDVSAVNYGANPYTSIAARAGSVLADMDHLPLGAARAAQERLASRLGPAPLTAQRSNGMSVALLQARLRATE